MVDVVAHLHEIEAIIRRVLNAQRREGEEQKRVDIICVSKTFETDVIEPLLIAGHRIFGENRVQEASVKWPQLKAIYPRVELHLIGPLQSNKVDLAFDLFDVFQTVDREKIAQKLAIKVKETGQKKKFFVQVNTGEEPQKAGISPTDVNDFIKFCSHELDLSITGLMCIPPADHQAAPHFAMLASLARQNDIQHLSMGMSEDYSIAVQLGASYVRVGSRIFGRR